MQSSRLASLLITPSVLSATVSFFLSALILSVTSWSYITPESPMYNYFFGPYGLTTIFQHSANAFSAINGIFGSSSAYNVAVILVAAFIGLLIYVFLEGIDHLSSQTSDTVRQIETAPEAAKKQLKKELELRIGLRIAALIVWICFLVFFARVIIPYAILIGRIDILNLGFMRVLWILSAVILLMVSFHINVICMRLLVLRPRLLGGDDILIEQIKD